MPDNDFNSQHMGEWISDYSWPKMRRSYASYSGGPRIQRLDKLLREQRRLFWEARRESVIVVRAIDFALSEGLEEVDALLIAVVGLIQQNRELMQNAQARIAEQP
jgi:hypothetical protein